MVDKLFSMAKNPGGAAILGMLIGVLGALVASGRIRPADFWERPKLEASGEMAGLRSVLRQELDPRLAAMEAGLKALASYQKPEVKVAMLESMEEARDKAIKKNREREDQEGNP